MTLLGDVDWPGSDIDEYIFGLEGILTTQLEFIKDLKTRLTSFKGHISQEQILSKRFYEEQEKNGEDVDMIDCFDMCQDIDDGFN